MRRIRSTTSRSTCCSPSPTARRFASPRFGPGAKSGGCATVRRRWAGTPGGANAATGPMPACMASAGRLRSRRIAATIRCSSTARSASPATGGISSMPTARPFFGWATPGGWASRTACIGRPIFRSLRPTARRRGSTSCRSWPGFIPTCPPSTRAARTRRAFRGRKTTRKSVPNISTPPIAACGIWSIRGSRPASSAPGAITCR